MATINGYTAERMKLIEDKAVIDGVVVGNDLILKRNNGQSINAGNVRGPAGTPGVQDVEAQMAAMLELADPPGTPKPYTGTTAPVGHGFCDAGAEYSSGTYPKLAALYGTGAACVNGASTAGTFRLPNLKGRVLVGRDASIPALDTLHKIGGNKDTAVISHSHTASASQSAHGHGASQGAHGHAVSAGGSHVHGVDNGDTGFRITVSVPTSTHYATGEGDPNKTQAISYTGLNQGGYHDHTTSVEAPGIGISVEQPGISVSVGATGGSGADANLMPYRVINWIMRLA